jgi:two-component system sensor histidine kinase CpxA
VLSPGKWAGFPAPGRLRSKGVTVRFPLWVKVWFLLALNFSLLAAVGLGWFLARGEAGWHALAQGPLGDRVAALADHLSAQLWVAAPAEGEALLASEGAARGMTFGWWRNDGRLLAGPAVVLPASVRAELTRGAGPSGPRAGGFVPEPPRGPGPPGARPGEAGRAGRFLVVADGAYWLGVRLHPSAEAVAEPGPPPRTTLLIKSPSALRLGWLLGVHWWGAIAAFVLGVSALFWLPFVRSVTRRLAALTEATERIAEGRFETRTADGPDEIGRLGASINGMAGRLQSHAEAQRRFLGDVAHEIGSPLGRLQVAIDLLERRAAADLTPAIADVREEVDQMAALVGELLAFTRAGLRPPAVKLAAVELAPLLAAVVSREEGEARVEVEVTADVRVQADEALLRRALANLVRNALRYGGDPICLRATRSGDAVVIRVADHGPGVPPAALNRLGEPFFRPETARSRETGGVGLGLTIVRSAVAACGGEVRFANGKPHGFVAEVRLRAA